LDCTWEDRGLLIGLFLFPVSILGLKPIIQELKDQAIQGAELVVGNPVQGLFHLFWHSDVNGNFHNYKL
jgi:hypothetical protein